MSRVTLLPSPAFGTYQQKRLANLRGLGPALCLDRWLEACGIHELVSQPVSGDWMAFHPWRPGWVPLERAKTEALHANDRIAERGWLAEGEPDLRGLCIRAIFDFAALQNPWELHQFLERVAARKPQTVIEIGTSAGGLLFAIAQLADPNAVLVSIDLPDPRDPPELRAAVPQVVASLIRPTQTLLSIRESSTFHSVRADVVTALAGRAVDLLIIDGDHSYGAVRSDFEMYAPLVRPGGLVALHDVMVRPENSGRGLDVGILWQELVATHQTETIADPNGVAGIATQRHVPYSARKAASLGWGLVVP